MNFQKVSLDPNVNNMFDTMCQTFLFIKTKI